MTKTYKKDGEIFTLEPCCDLGRCMYYQGTKRKVSIRPGKELEYHLPDGEEVPSKFEPVYGEGTKFPLHGGYFVEIRRVGNRLYPYHTDGHGWGVPATDKGGWPVDEFKTLDEVRGSVWSWLKDMQRPFEQEPMPDPKPSRTGLGPQKKWEKNAEDYVKQAVKDMEASHDDLISTFKSNFKDVKDYLDAHTTRVEEQINLSDAHALALLDIGSLTERLKKAEPLARKVPELEKDLQGWMDSAMKHVPRVMELEQQVVDARHQNKRLVFLSAALVAAQALYVLCGL